MPKAPRKPLISTQAYRELIDRNNLRYVDVAWICGVSLRQARAWALEEYPLPQYAALLLQAYDQRKLDAAWLALHIGSTPP